jgi:hypothetical protein
VEDTLRKVTQQTSNLVCSLIARFVLFQDKTLTQRRNRLLSMGFDHYDPLPAFGVTRWAVTMLIVGIITMAIVRFTPRAMPIDFTEAFLRVVVFAIQIGISIAAGTFVAQRFIRRREPTRAFLLIFELTSACLIVITMSSVVKIGGSLVSAVLSQHVSIDFGYIVGEFIDRWPAIMFPVVNTISIGVLCSYLTVLNLGRLGLAILGAICNGLAFVAAALLVGMVLPRTVLSELNVNVDAARLSIMVNSGLIGVAVGAMVLAMFRRNKPAADAHKISAPDGNGAVPSWEDTPTKGEWADKALGGYSRENTAEFEGSYVCFRPMFAKPGVINAYLMKIQWDAKQSCLTFEEGGRKDPYIQQGRIYIPNGKPFINLVTTEKGDVRLIVVCRPDAEGLARGLIMTLSVASGLSYTPASAPVVLRRLGNEEPPKLGFVHPGDTDYDLYHAQLLQVLPTYGVFGEPAVTASPEEAR